MTPAAPEAPVWAVLDRIGLPFRRTAAAMVADFGTKPCLWADGVQTCDLPSTALVPGLSAFGFLLSDGYDPTLPPTDFVAHYRGPTRLFDRVTDRLVQRNLAAVVPALQATLGPGEDASVSNTLARVWRFGMAQVMAMVFPPEKNNNPGVNIRHQRDPGSVSECSVRIHPGWLPPLTDDQIDMARGFRWIGSGQKVPDRGWLAPGPRPRWPHTAGPLPKTGYGVAGRGDGLVVVAGDLVMVLARADLIRLRRDVLTPAKGPGGVALVVEHAPRGVVGVQPHWLTLASTDYAATALDAEARGLAAALDLSLVQSEWADC